MLPLLCMHLLPNQVLKAFPVSDASTNSVVMYEDLVTQTVLNLFDLKLYTE